MPSAMAIGACLPWVLAGSFRRRTKSLRMACANEIPTVGRTLDLIAAFASLAVGLSEGVRPIALVLLWLKLRRAT